MTDRRIKAFILLMLAAVMSLSGCRKIRDISITSVALEAISPAGMRSLDVYLAVGIDNPAMQIELTDIQGALKYSGKIIGRLAMDPVKVQARSAEIYHVKANVSLAEGAGLKDLMVLMNEEALNSCLIDVSVRPKLKSGLSAPINLEDIPLKKLLDSAGNEKN